MLGACAKGILVPGLLTLNLELNPPKDEHYLFCTFDSL